MNTWFLLTALGKLFARRIVFRSNARQLEVLTAFQKASGRYEEVEEVCLRRGQRSCRIVRRLVEEG